MKYSTGNVSNKLFNLWLKMNKDVLKFVITIRRAFPFLIYFSICVKLHAADRYKKSQILRCLENFINWGILSCICLDEVYLSFDWNKRNNNEENKMKEDHTIQYPTEKE